MPNHNRLREELFDYDKLRGDLRVFIDRYGVTQSALASLIGISSASVSRILAGETAIVTVPTLFAICQITNVNPAHYCTEQLAEYVPEMHGLSYASIIAHADMLEESEEN